MRAAVLAAPGRLELRDVPTPHAGAGELVLRVGANTLCGTDGRILRGEKTAGVRPGVVLGHEIAGFVDEVGSGVTGFDEGDLVSVNPTVWCGTCYYCRHGLEHLCVAARLFGYALDGGLAEKVLIPREAVERGGVLRADPTLTPEEVALAEPLSCVVSGARSYRPEPGDTVLILGAGPIGLLHVQVARAAGAAQILVSNRSRPRRDIALAMGATDAVDPTLTDVEAYAREATGGLGVDIAVVCIGKPELFAEALRCVRRRGRVSAFAGFPRGTTAEIDPNLIHYGEIEVVGGSNFGPAAHARALEMLAHHEVDAASLVSDVYALDDVEEAIERASSGAGLKVAVTP